MNRFIKYFPAITLLFLLSTMIPVRAANPTLPGLSISGIEIVANGRPVRLRGVNMGDPVWARNPDWYNYSLADYNTLSQTWHANVVRISVFPTQWKSMDHTALLARLSQEINAALDSGIYVIIAYHVIGWPDGYYQPPYPGNPADTYDSSMSVATSFWTQMAQTYGSDTRIIFDLWNEPVHDSSDYVGSDPNPFWPILKVYYENLIQTVRNNGAQNIVIATGNRWASWLVGIKDNPLADPNVIYAYHKYSIEGLNTAAQWDEDTGGLIGVKPVIVSEWGYEDVDAGLNHTWPGSQATYGDPFTQWMESHNLSNLAWVYHHDWTPALLKSDGSLTLYGDFVQQYTVSNYIPAIFADVPPSYWASSYIERLFNAGITGGCSVTPLNYCPDNTVTRAQMAVFLLKGMHGSSYTPPVVGASTGFTDVAIDYWAAAWIKQLAAEGITGGCGAGIYCPDATVTRAQMAIFLLRAKHGSSYSPPAATGVFTDVHVGYWADKWIEQLAVEGITGGCGTNIYCPDDSVTRAQMAVFLVRTFNLP